MIAEPITAEREYERACKDIARWQRLIAAGWLTARELDRARREIVRASGRKVQAERAMEER